MTSIGNPPPDAAKLEQFVFRAVEEAGATLNTALVVMGDRLGLYRTLAGAGGSPRLSSQRAPAPPSATCASGSTPRPPAATSPTTRPTARTACRPSRRSHLTDEDSPAYLPGLFQNALGTVLDSPQVTEAARTGAGVGWHEHNQHVHDGCERFFRPGYNANLIDSWLPALDGVVAKLQEGARVADVGCGHGASTILMAQAFPNSTFVGSDYHAGSIETARRRAAQSGAGDRIRFEVEPASAYSGEGYDLVTMFDCLHDMGDPAGAARHVLDTLAPDGTWMIVEPAAGDRVEDNLNPIGRAYYGFSTLLCTPASLSQDVGLALGAQAGEARLREVVTAGGFARFRRATETPFNLVLEARP